MLKNFTVLSFVLLCMHSATAQQAVKNSRDLFAKHFRPTTGAKTTAMESRLIGMSSYYETTLDFGDTVRAWYSGNNGFAPELGEYFPWKVDSVMMWDYDASLPGIVPAYRLKSDINTAKQLTALNYEYWDDNSGSWNLDQVVRYAYTSAGQLASFMEAYESGLGWDSSKTILTYNSQGLLAQELYQDWDGSAWEDVSRTTYTYNSNGGVATELNEYYSLSSWGPISRRTYTYTGNKITSILSESHNGTSWQNSGTTTVTYNSAGQITDSLEKDAAGADKFRHMFSYNSAGDTVTTIIQMAWNGNLENQRRETAAYNSFHQQTFLRTEFWNAGNMEFDLENGGEEHFYYEQFTNSVKDLSANANGKMHLYPVPARDNINLELDWKNAAAASITLCDMTGRIVKNWNTPAVKTYKNQLDITGLPSGNYILKIAAGADRLMQQLSIVK